MWKTELTAISTKKGKWKLILITALVAFIFINFFEPFDVYADSKSDSFTIFIEITLAILGLVVSMIITHFFIINFFKINALNYLTIIPWFLFESLLIAIIWSAMSVFIEGSDIAVFDLIVTNYIECVFLISLPFFGTVFYLNTVNRKQKLNQLQEAAGEQKINGETIVVFSDKGGKEKLSLRLQDVFYIESNDNYVHIHFLVGEKKQKLLLRNTIKNLEIDLMPFNIVRCHRSFLVNVLNVKRKEKQTKGSVFYLKDLENTLVPISKSYSSEMNKTLK
jgi:DNA-binding LytR/AlgR family response regulator